MKKNYLLLSLCIVFTACEKEENVAIPSEPDFENYSDEMSVKILEKDQIEGNKDIFKELNQFKIHNEKIVKREVAISDYQFVVNTSRAKYIKKGDYHSYSFPIQRTDGNGNVENLVLSSISNKKYKVFLVNYGFTKEELPNMNKKEITSTSTKIIPINFDYYNIINTSSKQNIEYICSEEWELLCPTHGSSSGDCNDWDKYSEWTLTNINCSYGSGGQTNDPTSGGTTGGGSGNDTPCTGLKANAPCDGEDEVITGPILLEDDRTAQEEDCNTSLEDLKKVFPDTDDTTLSEIANYINKYGKDFGINTKEKLQHFLAQAGHESTSVITGVEFGAFEENLNFRVKKLGIDYWKDFFNPWTNPTANPKKENPFDYEASQGSTFVNNEKYANYIYSDQSRGENFLGNVNQGDGYKYRGRGIIQLTGRNNYTAFNEFYQNEYDSSVDFLLNPNALAKDPEIAVISALWFFQEVVLANENIDQSTSVEKITKLVNGGDNGLVHRKNLHNKSQIEINCI
jgi:putative chitinase